LPLVLVFGLAVLRVPPFVADLRRSVIWRVLGHRFNPQKVIAFAQDPALPEPLALLKGIWSALATGYISNTGEADIDRLLSRGGMGSMLNTIWLIMTALAFGAVLEHAGMLNRLIEPIVSRVRTIGSLVTAVVASCIGINLIASD
jgi:NhaC family Na+:H+ antiporter